MDAISAAVRVAIQNQLSSIAKKKKSQRNANDRYVLKLDHACGTLKTEPRKRSRENTASETIASTHGFTASAVFLRQVGDALLSICSAQDDVRTTLAQCSSTLQARHCHLTSTCVDGSADGGTLCTLLFSTATCAAWASQLTCLDLECNALGDEGLQRLVESVLPRLPRLEGLHLASNGIGVAGLEALTTWVLRTDSEPEESVPGLRVLGLTNNPLFIPSSMSLSSSSSSSSCGAHLPLNRLLATILRQWRATIRRVYLNHVGLNARTVASVLGQLSSFADDGLTFPHLDTLYMKQNEGLTRAALESEIAQCARDESALRETLAFVDAHMELE